MEATVRLLDDEPKVAVQVLWRGAELNLLRDRDEPLERFLVRLGMSCSRHVGGGGDRKRAKKERKKMTPVTGLGNTEAVPCGTNIVTGLVDAE